MAPLRRFASLACTLDFACLAAFASTATAQTDDTTGNDVVLGGWPTIPIGDNEIKFLVYAIGDQSNYDPSLKVGVCFNSVFQLQYQSVAGTNFRYQGHGCLLEAGSAGIGGCASECAVELLQVTIFSQEWTNTVAVRDIARLQVTE